VHILGFAETFRNTILEAGLATTRAACRERIQAMVQKCHHAGFTRVSMKSIEDRYASFVNPSFISFDIARELQQQYQLSVTEAHRMTVFGGRCYVPYSPAGLLAPQEAVALLHSAGGVAVMAHPGISSVEEGETFFSELVTDLIKHHIDGLEVRHPFHTPAMVERLTQVAHEHHLLITAGSDWHGLSRFVDNNAQFGRIGATEEEWMTLLTRCAELA